MVNKRTVEWHPSPSQLTSRMHPLMFLWTHKGFISPEYFFNFFLKLYIPPWLRKSLKFIVKITGKSILSHKIESVHFYTCQQNSSASFYHYPPPPQAERHFPFLPNSVFWRYIFPQQKEDGGKNTKIKPTRVLVTSFDKFHHLWFLFCCATI